MNLKELSRHNINKLVKDKIKRVNIGSDAEWLAFNGDGYYAIDESLDGRYTDPNKLNCGNHIPFGRNTMHHRDHRNVLGRTALRSTEDPSRFYENEVYSRNVGDFARDFVHATRNWNTSTDAAKVVLCGIEYEVSGALKGLLRLENSRQDIRVAFYCRTDKSYGAQFPIDPDYY